MKLKVQSTNLLNRLQRIPETPSSFRNQNDTAARVFFFTEFSIRDFSDEPLCAVLVES